jgi:hypothetical protein
MINTPSFDQFSSAYCGLVLFPIQVLICSVKDLKVFMRVGSFGVVFVIFLIIFICAVGTYGLTNTEYTFGTTEEANETIWESNMRILVLWNVNFSPLAGILCTGYFLHTISLPILR